MGRHVGKKIDQNLFRESKIELQRRQVGGNLNLDGTPSEGAADVLKGRMHEVACVLPVELWAQLARFQTGKVEKVLHEAVQP